MNALVPIQHWLYSGMASDLGEVASGNARTIFAAMAAAVLFGAAHALMPGHGKTVLVSYHLGPAGQDARGPRQLDAQTVLPPSAQTPPTPVRNPAQ